MHLKEKIEPFYINKEKIELKIELWNTLNSLGTVDGALRGLELMVPWYEVVIVINTKIVYLKIPELLMVIFLKC